MAREGVLKKNDCKRFEFDGYELTSGDAVELLIGQHWIYGHIEHTCNYGYVFVHSSGMLIPVPGMKARVPN